MSAKDCHIAICVMVYVGRAKKNLSRRLRFDISSSLDSKILQMPSARVFGKTFPRTFLREYGRARFRDFPNEADG